MLCFGTSSMVNYIIDGETKVYNLSSYLQTEQLNLLPPFRMQFDERSFDIDYYNYIFNNNVPFMEIMKIMMDLYSGLNVYIAIYDEDTHWFIAESLQKAIQERYGVISYIIKDPSDLCFELEDKGVKFSQSGIINFDNDKMRYIQLSTNNTGGDYY